MDLDLKSQVQKNLNGNMVVKGVFIVSTVKDKGVKRKGIEEAEKGRKGGREGGREEGREG